MGNNKKKKKRASVADRPIRGPKKFLEKLANLKLESDRSHQKVTTGEDLPDDIMWIILSKLKLKDILRVSSSSKNWVHLPGRLTKIVFDNDNMAEPGTQLCCPEHKDSFSRGVAQLLNLYGKCQAAPLSELDLNFCFDHESSDDISSWIAFAIQRGVESINVALKCDFHGETAMNPDPASAKGMYAFPFDLMNTSNAKLHTIYLRRCVFGQNISNKCHSLRELHLSETIITELGLYNAIQSCPNLERVFIIRCTIHGKLVVASASMTFLDVQNCSGMEEIVLDSTTLTQFTYVGLDVKFVGQTVPKLTGLAFCMGSQNGVNYFFQDVHRDFPAMRRISYYATCNTYISLTSFCGRMSAFLKLQKLELYFNPSGKFSFPMMLAILKESPVLEELIMAPPYSLEAEDAVEFPVQSFHRSLTSIRVEGFCGSKDTVMLLRFLIEASTTLKEVIIVTTTKIKMKRSEYEKNGLWRNSQDPSVVVDFLRGLMKSGSLTFL